MAINTLEVPLRRDFLFRAQTMGIGTRSCRPTCLTESVPCPKSRSCGRGETGRRKRLKISQPCAIRVRSPSSAPHLRGCEVPAYQASIPYRPRPSVVKVRRCRNTQKRQAEKHCAEFPFLEIRDIQNFRLIFRRFRLRKIRSSRPSPELQSGAFVKTRLQYSACFGRRGRLRHVLHNLPRLCEKTWAET